MSPTTLVGGGIGFVLITLMAATSTNRTAALLGRRVWKVLHTIGMYFLWVVFAFSYLPRVHSPPYTVLVGLLLLALGLRLIVTARRLGRHRSK